MSTILVTGASGHLGSQLVLRLLSNGDSVRVYLRRELEHPLLSDSELECRIGELNNLSRLRDAMEGCSQVYHVAGMVSYLDGDREALHVANVVGTRTVLTAARAAGVKRVVVTSSTASVGLGGTPGDGLDEEAEWQDRWDAVPYMQSKREAERLALDMSCDTTEVVAVCPTTIYGAGDVHMNTGAIFERISAGKMKLAPPAGTSIVSVTDCVTGHLLAMKSGQPGERYILATSDHRYRDLFSRIARALEAAPPSASLPKVGYPILLGAARLANVVGLKKVSHHMVRIGFRNRYFSAKKAERELGWTPTQTADEMLQEAANFYREHGLIK